MIRKIVHDEVPLALGVAGVDSVEQFDEDFAAALVGGETKQRAATDIVGTHEAEHAVADVLELASYGLSWLHGQIRMAPSGSLHPGFLVDADDVNLAACQRAGRSVALFAKLVVVEVTHIFCR